MLNLSPNNISRRKSCVAAVFLITGQIDSLLKIPFLSFFSSFEHESNKES